ncbi:MAG: LysR substrate-binding domain-containing protein [Gammaproteobacteria bacterium]|jgi:DNA-binding transcriptional LysR family regulator
MADKRLLAFHAVARLLSFTRAADSLQMTQPAVTFQIKQLEEQLNVRLFDRSHNRISLTEAGRRAFDFAERIFGLYGEMDNAIREVTDDVSGVVRIAAGNAMAQYILTPMLANFSQAFPSVQVRLDVASCAQVISMVENSFADIGVVEMNINTKKLISQPYNEMAWRFVTSPHHPLARTRVITPEILEQATWIMANDAQDAREIVMRYLQDVGVDFARLRIAMEMGNLLMIKNAVEAGQGVAILPQAAITKELKLGTLVAPSLEKPLQKQISFIYKQQKFPLKIVDELLNLTREPEAVAC